MLGDIPKCLRRSQSLYQAAVNDGHKGFWSERFNLGLPPVEKLTLFVVSRTMALITEGDEITWSVTSILLPKAYVMDLEDLL